MKRIISLISIVILAFAFESFTFPKNKEEKVYICENSKVYHRTRSCRALANAKFRAVSERDAAKKYHRRKCLICY